MTARHARTRAQSRAHRREARAQLDATLAREDRHPLSGDTTRRLDAPMGFWVPDFGHDMTDLDNVTRDAWSDDPDRTTRRNL